MDYKKKYEEALAHAREIHRNEVEKRRDMEFIFPELAESEDEKVRKFLIEDIKDTLSSEDFKHYNPEHTKKLEEALAWLEKQGEQKPQGKSALESIKEEKVDNQNCVKPADKVEPKFSVGDIIKITGINNGHTGFSILNTEDSYYYNWKLVENKSAWSEEDELVIKDIEEAITNYWHGYTQNILLDWLKSLKEKIGG